VEKRCTGCKEVKGIDSFYKNKLTPDGHSIYCVDCTRVNSKKYFEKKKLRENKLQNENLIKDVLLSNFGGVDKTQIDSLMKVVVIEKMVHNILDELNQLKKSYLKNERLSEIEL
jgi:acetyl-CoA carboxylase alpha subunit